MTPEHYDVIVIGGGQAGLAVGHHLARQGRRFTILDAAPPPGGGLARALGLAAAVHARALRQPARPRLPRRPRPLPHPRRGRRLPHRLRPPLRRSPSNSTAASPRRTPKSGGYRVELADRALHAHQVVIATGPFQVPRVPRSPAS